MELTLSELWLFVWAVIATGYAFKRDADARMYIKMLQTIFENKQAREEILTQFDKFKERTNASQS